MLGDVTENNISLPNIVDGTNPILYERSKLVHTQPIRNLTTTIQIEDEKGNILDTISGKAISSNISMDGSSLIRRTGSITLVLDDAYMPSKNSVLWYGKFFKLYQGIFDYETFPQENVNFLLGTYLLDETSLNIDSTNSTIQITLSDKMTQYESDGARATLEHELSIPRGTPITDALRAVMELVGETSFGRMDECLPEEVVPYDYTKEVGSNVVDIIKDLRDMYMDYICGYDLLGRFEFVKVQVQKETDTIDTVWDFDSTTQDRADMTVSFSETYSLKNVKNRVIVFGGTSSTTGLTPQGEIKITDANNPFNVDAIGQRTKVYVENNLSNDMQCVAKARYYIYQTAHFQEQATIKCIPVYILKPGDIVSIVNPVTKESYRYYVDTIKVNLGIDGTMDITAHKLYYVGLDYGSEDIPIVAAIKRGIGQLGWISLGEQRIKDCFGLSGSGDNTLMIRFISNQMGGEQAAVTGYLTTKTQTLELDIKDFETLNLKDENGDVGRSSGDYVDRVLAHEMFHAVCNDYYSTSKTIDFPTWWKEGFAELIHGGKDRYTSLTGFTSVEDKKQSLITKCRNVLDGEWNSTSEDYVAAYLLACGMYFIVDTTDEFKKIFTRLKEEKNINLNFLSKCLPNIGTDNESIKTQLIDTVSKMPLWNALNDISDVDTCSIGGSHMMNTFNMPLSPEDVFNNATATTASIGFKLQYDE